MTDAQIYFLTANAWWIAAISLPGPQTVAVVIGWICFFALVAASVPKSEK